jgi:hypothetical protein
MFTAAAGRPRAKRWVAVTSAAILAAVACAPADNALGSDDFEPPVVIHDPYGDAPVYLTSQAGQPGVSPAPDALQPAPLSTSPSTSPPSPFAANEGLRSLFATSFRSRLASTPDMFGDFFGRGGTIVGTDSLGAIAPLAFTGRADLPLAGGSRGLKIGEHNKAMPVDRVYFNYNHYHNALRFGAGGTPLPGAPFTAARDLSIDRFTLGLEKTWLCGWASIELRMPLSGGYDFNFSPGLPGAIMTAEGGNIGNLSIIPKLLLYQDDCSALSVGLGIETPTGSDAEARIAFTRYRIENEAVHLHPYVALLSQLGSNWFVNAFAQVDVATNGNSVSFQAAGDLPGAGTFGVYDEQTLLHLDLSMGRWIYRDPCAPLVTGLAGIVEWHYTTALEDTDVVTGARATGIPPGATLDFRNRANRFDVLNLTAGIHAEIARDMTFRVGGAFPLRTGDDRFFDAEVIAQLSRRF